MRKCDHDFKMRPSSYGVVGVGVGGGGRGERGEGGLVGKKRALQDKKTFSSEVPKDWACVHFSWEKGTIL